MPKSNAEKCRDYRQRKKANKVKKITKSKKPKSKKAKSKKPKSSTERVREFRARRKGLFNEQHNIYIAENNTSTVQNSECDNLHDNLFEMKDTKLQQIELENSEKMNHPMKIDNVSIDLKREIAKDNSVQEESHRVVIKLEIKDEPEDSDVDKTWALHNDYDIKNEPDEISTRLDQNFIDSSELQEHLKTWPICKEEAEKRMKAIPDINRSVDVEDTDQSVKLTLNLKQRSFICHDCCTSFEKVNELLTHLQLHL